MVSQFPSPLVLSRSNSEGWKLLGKMDPSLSQNDPDRIILTAHSLRPQACRESLPLSSSSAQPRWSREQIRAARLAPLAPLLENRGLQLIAREGGNFILPAYPGLILKDSYWR